MFSADRIAAVRKSKGFSQELLAEQSGVSLRTIQRVEQGDTMPRGYTLQALAAALEVSLDDFRAQPAPPIAVTSSTPRLRSDPDFLQLLNLSALSFLFMPLLNIVVPWWLWRTRRHDTEHVAEVGRRLLGFQILWQVGCFFAFLLVVVIQLLVGHPHRTLLPGLYLGVLVLTYAVNVAAVGHATWQLRQGQLDIYRFRF